MSDVEVRTSGSPQSLRDLGRVGLDIERLPSALPDEGLDEQELSKFIRDRLDKAPVQVLSRTGALHLRGAPTLFLNVTSFEQQPGPSAYLITLELVQGARLERSNDAQTFLGVPTWRAQVVRFAEKGKLAELKDGIGATADAFVKDLAGA